MSYELITPSSELPVSLAEAKAWARVTTASEDALFNILIATATSQAEDYTHRRFVRQTWKQYADSWPSGREIYVGYPPLISVSNIKYKDADGALETLSTDDYETDRNHFPGRIYRLSSYWPTLKSCSINGVQIEFVCGYGGADAVPDAVKEAVLAQVAYLYENRGDTEKDLCTVSKMILYPFICFVLP